MARHGFRKILRRRMIKNSPPDQRDQESGLDYAADRYYQGNAGRYQSVDQGEPWLERRQTLNRYVAMIVDPINYSDPSGSIPVGLRSIVPAPVACFDNFGRPMPASSPGCWDISDHLLLIATIIVWERESIQQDCTNGLRPEWVDFVEAHYSDAVRLSNGSGVPVEWILGWAAEESGYGQGRFARLQNNYFSWRGNGDIVCPESAQGNPFGCYSSFLASGIDALFSRENYLRYLTCNIPAVNQRGCVTVAEILKDQIFKGASVQGAFQAVRDAGYASNPNYGASVRRKVNDVTLTINCLKSQGRL